ncbi:MAG: restriction endonuclease subunit S [Oscillospiraceae bacterium]|nr:restriction endonuclease subunit S [Oscillospiraceae bacterium]
MKRVEWGEYRLGDLFNIDTSVKRFDANKVTVLENGKYPYVVRMSSNNGQKGFLDEDVKFLNQGNTIAFGQDTATMYYQERPYFTGDKIKILSPKISRFRKENAQFILTAMHLAFSQFAWGSSSFNTDVLQAQIITLPTKNHKIDFDFMESFIAELEAERIAELSAYLTVSGLDNCELSSEERQAVDDYSNLVWQKFNVKELFGESTRGKRLKSDDRIKGTLPFVTAGEADEGISAFIGNDVEIFSKNTTTIDMFGSAKYRNYDYGADDHIAVVHTENLSKYAAIFVTTACHKAAHTGEFHYGHNFYAKDADKLNISLPVKDNEPDFAFMQTLISAVQKLAIKDVVLYTDKNIAATKAVVSSPEN